MGCVSVSSSSFSEYCTTTEFKEWKDRLHAVNLDKSAIRQLYNMFLRVDLENKSRVHHLHLSKNFAVDQTKFAERIWCVLSEDDLGELCFAQFVLTLYTFCSLTREELGESPSIPSVDQSSLYLTFFNLHNSRSVVRV